MPSDILSSGGGAARGGGGGAQHRFSLLHLDEGEDYVADFVGLCKPPCGALPDIYSGAVGGGGVNGKLRGRLRLLSRSLVFDPDDVAVPLLKFPLVAVSRLDATGGVHAAFELVCSR
jgi:factor associated with neutral sphingomyelinase activation